MAGGFTGGARWTQRVLDQKLSRALALASSGKFQQDLQEELDYIAEDVSMVIRGSGRASGHSDFANFQAKVTRSAGDRYTARLGWLTYPTSAQERGGGGKLWYQYQNWGYDLFGQGRVRIQGLGFLDGVDARFQRALQRSADRYIKDMKDVLR